MGERIDGRALDELRPISFEVDWLRPHTVLVKYGETWVVCFPSLEERVPGWRYGSGLGWATAEYAILPGATDTRSSRERGSVSGRTQEIERLIGRAIRTLVDFEALGQRTLRVDCDVLKADGGTRTAAISGACLALYALMREVYPIFNRYPLSGRVSAVSAGIVDGKVMLDLNYYEDSRAELDANLVLFNGTEIVEFQSTAEKQGGVSRDELMEVFQLAFEGARKIDQVLQEEVARLLKGARG